MGSLFDINWYTPLSQLAPSLQTGDIVLVHGRYAFSIVIETIEWSPFSHSAIAIRAADVGLEGKAPDLLLWESNSLTNLPDVLSGKTKTGPMLVDFMARMQDTEKQFSDVKYACRHLYVERTPEMMAALTAFMPTVLSARFPSDVQMGERLWAGRVRNKQASSDLLFCSELVADTYMHMGLLNTHYVMNAYEPRDFTDTGTVRLLQQGWLGPEIFFDALT